jgi:hypothetical protein
MLCCACGLREGVVQKEPQSFLWFTGNTQNAVVYIDDLAPFTLSEENDELIHYEISPGKHEIVVKRSGNEIVNRVVLLGSGMTKEIQIP